MAFGSSIGSPIDTSKPDILSNTGGRAAPKSKVSFAKIAIITLIALFTLSVICVVLFNSGIE